MSDWFDLINKGSVSDKERLTLSGYIKSLVSDYTDHKHTLNINFNSIYGL